jgi:hypothetical protein
MFSWNSDSLPSHQHPPLVSLTVTSPSWLPLPLPSFTPDCSTVPLSLSVPVPLPISSEVTHQRMSLFCLKSHKEGALCFWMNEWKDGWRINPLLLPYQTHQLCPPGFPSEPCLRSLPILDFWFLPVESTQVSQQPIPTYPSWVTLPPNCLCTVSGTQNSISLSHSSYPVIW